ncbi:hypothetical protein WISP_47238 [Willisornis vidua]|uniref:Alpha-1,3/1,6-mannosyltransferase ALG2 n=1 Tax=Willisornis vidua TaxID=1566151 RepID=A0ABQ9DK25_9PASS|nr:hypothetical protein WISP_47238 [Willisornis vidua]
MACLALYVLLLSGETCDAFVCDQLLTKRESFLKRLYRWPLDWLEEYTTGMADCIVVNSRFTASVFKDTFKSLSHINPDVLYPSLNISSFETIVPADIADLIPKEKKFLFLSINRFLNAEFIEYSAAKCLQDGWSQGIEYERESGEEGAERMKSRRAALRHHTALAADILQWVEKEEDAELKKNISPEISSASGSSFTNSFDNFSPSLLSLSLA